METTKAGAPTIVCLCGSTRFMEAFQRAEFAETLAGRIVLTIGCDTKSDGELFKGPEGAATKAKLDALHKQKIDLADEILVLNVGGYIGDSTRSEIEHAKKQGKRIRWLVPPAPAAETLVGYPTFLRGLAQASIGENSTKLSASADALERLSISTDHLADIIKERTKERDELRARLARIQAAAGDVAGLMRVIEEGGGA